LQLAIARQLGGKIAEIQDATSGRQWLARHPRLAWRVPSADELSAKDAYVRLGDLGGWDECCPTIAPSVYPWPPFEGRPLPDHGECWSQAPEERWENGAVEHRWRGSSLPYELVRELRLDPEQPSLALGYRLASRAAHPLAILWCAHPLFTIEKGMRIDVRHRTPMVVVSTGSPLGAVGTRFAWPVCNGIDLSEVTPDAGWAVKLYSEVLDPGEVALVGRSGGHLRIAWSSTGNAGLRLGLWLNYGGWSGDDGPLLHNLGLEPTLGMSDSLAEAIADGTACVLEPGNERRWQLRVDVS